jgi:tetratricopeptide (TPR) repeat protein
VSSSLVQLEHVSAESGRYRMLEPLRHYARVRLAERGETTTTARRHARHYLALIEGAEPHFYRAGSAPWIDRIRTEHDNLRAALQWAFGPYGDGRLGAHMAALLWHPWDLAGARTEGLHWIDAGLQVTSEPARRMPLLAAATLLRLGLGEITAAGDHATEQLELAREPADRRWEGDALTRLGMIAWTRGDLPAATTHLRQAVEALGNAKEKWRESIALAHLARIQRDARQLLAATATGQSALATARQVGEDTALGFALDVLASVLHLRGRTASAAELVEQALAHYRTIGYQEGEASALQATGRLLSDRGDPDASRQAFTAALKLCLRLGHRGGIVASLEGLAGALLAGGDDTHAAVVYGAATAQLSLLDPTAPGMQRRALEEIRTKLVATQGADRLRQAIRQGAETDIENL